MMSSESQRAHNIADQAGMARNLGATKLNPLQEDMISGLRDAFNRANARIIWTCIPCRERSRALSALEDSMMWAIAAITRVYEPTEC